MTGAARHFDQVVDSRPVRPHVDAVAVEHAVGELALVPVRVCVCVCREVFWGGGGGVSGTMAAGGRARAAAAPQAPCVRLHLSLFGKRRTP